MAVKQRRRVVENTIAQLRKWNIVSGKYRCKNSESADLTQFFIKMHPYCQCFCESPHSEEAVEKTLNYPLHAKKFVFVLFFPFHMLSLFHPILYLTSSFLVVLGGDAPPLAEGLSQNKTA
jgi:hypothetical protein